MKKAHPYTTNIPAARIELRSIAERLEAGGIQDIADEIRQIVEEKLIRRAGGRRAPATRVEITSEIRSEVIDLLKKTNLPQEEIARRFNIDGGRVSEIYRSIRN